MTLRSIIEDGEVRAHRALRHLDEELVSEQLRRNWRRVPRGFSGFNSRLNRDRTEVIPWLNRTRPLDGADVLEIGAGAGASTLSLAEQGAHVTGIDVDAAALARAEKLLTYAGVQATFKQLDAAELATGERRSFDLIIFWASLEHMTMDERLRALRDTWRLVRRGGYLAIVETPNRLWPLDMHTSHLPFFQWLPDDLAFAYTRFSTRQQFGGAYNSAENEMVEFLRRGRGVSYHEFDIAISPDVQVASCMQTERRRRNPIRGLAWATSTAGRTERLLHSFAPPRDPAWFQPFLYLALQKPDREISIDVTTSGHSLTEPTRK
jgi:S-adenosylmethionine-dependent methyltransferase